MSDDKKTCSMCQRFEPYKLRHGRCRAPVPFWLTGDQLVSPADVRAAECDCFEPIFEKVEEVPFA